MLKGGQELAGASLVCRADEITGTSQPRGSFEGERECGRRQEALIEGYAKAADCWLDLTNLDPDALIGSGGESEVYRYSDDEVLKVNTTRYTVSPQILLDRIAIHNALFPATRMTVLGFGRNSFGEFCVAYTQPFVEGTKPTREQIDSLLNTIEKENLKEYAKGGHNYKTDYLLYDDLHEENIIVDRYSGKTLVIDSDIRFNTPSLGLGGKYEIPPVDDDYLIDINIQDTNAMPKDTDTNTNSAHIEGLVYSCDIMELGEGRVAAKMEVCTASVRKNEDGTATYSNWLHHRVIATADGTVADKLRKARETYLSNRDNYGREGFIPEQIPVSLTGPLAYNDKLEPYIRVENISFPKKTRMKNTMTLRGEIVETSHNDAYASAMIECLSNDGESVKVPICIYNRDNPRKWADLSSGKTKRGDILNVTGPLVSRNFGDGEKKMYRCTVNVDNYTVMNRRNTQKETTTLGF